MKKKKSKKRVSYSFSSKKKLLGDLKIGKKKTDMSGIKGVGKKKCHVENDKKKRVFAKNVCLNKG